MEIERLEKELESIKTATENLKNGNITPDDLNIIIQILRQVEFDKTRNLDQIKRNLEDDRAYMETHRGTRR